MLTVLLKQQGTLTKTHHSDSVNGAFLLVFCSLMLINSTAYDEHIVHYNVSQKTTPYTRVDNYAKY